MPSSRTRRRRHLAGHKQNAIAVTVALAVLLAGVITYVVYHNVAGDKDDFSGNGNSTSPWSEWMKVTRFPRCPRRWWTRRSCRRVVL